jgi:C_GCAxxG_C_C family probable redox protein
MNKDQKATDYFCSRMNCAQSVFVPFAEEYGINLETAFKLSTPFGGGILGRKEMCGAVTGALMALSLKYGKTGIDDINGKERAYSKANEFIENFLEHHGYLLCRELLEKGPQNEEEAKIAMEKTIQRAVCPKFVKTAVLLAENMIK